ncbi:RpiB/LacA/LacB family sugar-phosphate isomerase [Candidatus Woesebacteria bacterium]|nr:RpiB/LacA/LacB family sugar-phosphate isomerase [Candidatus Woesebacteria bacterium]QQG47597.1 MAG: RpiB/LacA/LacB family sugar-phosphate isomerase [Candidatus Woesebacteria bacterium]
MKVYIGADHRGFELKEKIINWLKEWKYEFEDMGAYKNDPKDDYTLYAEKVASVVGNGQDNFGILLCGSGVGVDVMANKFGSIRASIGKDPKQVKAGRNDDNMNILVIAADFTNEREAREMVHEFLKTEFGDKARYKRRIDEIQRVEENRND